MFLNYIFRFQLPIFRSLLFFFIVCWGFPLVAQQTQNVTSDGTKFFLYTPPGYNATETYPLLVYLHGGGDVTDDYDLNALLTGIHHGPPWLINQDQWPAQRPFVMVAPLLKKNPALANIDQVWDMTVVDNFIEYIKSTCYINSNKIYLTGMSLGAAACWKYATIHPEKVAGIVPFSGNTDVTKACTLIDIPVWVFHGTEDGLVSPVQSIQMVNAMNACQPQGKYHPHLNLLFGRYHEGWNEVYDGSDGYKVFDWLLQFSKGDTDNKPPYVTAGADLKIINRATSFHLAGEFFDPDGTLSSVTWSQMSGPALTLSNISRKLLQLDDLVEGSFQFKLEVTDNLGAQNSDTVQLQILPASPVPSPAVTAISLLNASTNAEILALSEGMIINKNTLGVSSFHIKATTSNNGGSVIFFANSDRKTILSTTPGPYLLTYQSLPLGDYNICATAYSEAYVPGLPGVTECYKISVFDQPVKNLYPKSGADIGLLNSWGPNVDGSGAAPLSFTDNFQNFNVDKVAMLNNPLSLGGVQSNLYIKNGGQLTVNNNLNAIINTEGNAVVTINTSQPVTFGTISSASTVSFDQNALTIPAGTYGNIMVIGSGSTKTLTPGVTFITGNLTIADNVTVQGAADNSSVLSLSGNMTINENATFEPPVKFGLQMGTTNLQTLDIKATKAVFNQLTIAANGSVDLTVQASPVTLELGSPTGGGLTVNTGGDLNFHANNLVLSQNGSLNRLNQTGMLAFNDGTLNIHSTTSSNSYLYLASGYNFLQSLTIDQSGGAQFNIQTATNISDFVKSKNGTLHTNGNLSLVSSLDKTARIQTIEGTGVIEGSVEFQRFIGGTNMYKYISFPVSNVKVSDLQTFIPVTGNFDGVSTGFPADSKASLYYYDEPNSGWKQFPHITNTEEFVVGKGYSIYLLQGSSETTVKVKGPIQQGDFSFQLTPDPDINNADDGWNLIGNPYASPIQWGGSGWSKTNVNGTAYIRDNTQAGGRFLVWDGTTGDAEFAGLIAQGQSMWVRTTGSSPQLVISETAKADVGNAALWRVKQDSVSENRLIVELKKNDLTDRTYLKFSPAATDRFDTQIDAVKQKNGYFNLSTLSTDSVSLAINNLSDTSCVKLIGVAATAQDPGSYSLSFHGNLLDKPSREIYLMDHYLGARIALTQNTRYDFSITGDEASSGTKRFKIGMKATSTKPIISTEGSVLKSDVEEGNQWLLNGEIISGATSPTFKTTQPGIYQVRIMDGTCGVISDNFTMSITGLPERLVPDIKIYPNPTCGLFHLQGWPPGDTGIRYRIINLYGMEVQRGELSVKNFRDGTDIQLDNAVHSGIYILRLENDHLNYTSKLAVE